MLAHFAQNYYLKMNPEDQETLDKYQERFIHIWGYQHLDVKLTFNQMLIRALFIDKNIKKKTFLNIAKRYILKDKK